MRKNIRLHWIIPLVFVAVLLLFYGLFQTDNKYTAALPGGAGYNVLQRTSEEVSFLVDGWEYYPGQLLAPADFQADPPAAETIYIGEYPNFSAHLGTPYGLATYRIRLENQGPPRELALYLPELLCAGRIYINGELAGEQGSLAPYEPLVSDAVYAFRIEDSAEILIQCANYTHYYSGLYYPPAIGTPGAISRLLVARMAVYGFLSFTALAIALSNLALWLRSRDPLARWMGLLCFAFALRMCYPFVRALGLPLIRPLYALEDFCGSAVLLCAILLAEELSAGKSRRKHWRAAVFLGVSLCAVSVVFPLFILPYAPSFINTYGLFLFGWKLLAGCYLLFLSLQGMKSNNPYAQHLLCASGLFGLCMAASVLAVNRFEPIRGAWPEEYGGFVLVVGFAVLMVHRGFLLTAENQRLNLHLQDEVERKTRALETLLAERRELLANLIHDVKNPLTAVRSYTDLVRSGGTALDDETSQYLDALADRVDAVEDRFNSLQGFSREERLHLTAGSLCLNDFMQRFYQANRPDIELSGHTFHLELPDAPLFVTGNPGRLQVALENLCYNALSFTPPDGSITLSLRREEDWALISVADTGVGIRSEDLPHVFKRGFTRRADHSGDGLGLFIVHTVALEHGGMAKVDSRPNEGAVFSLYLPLVSAAP